MTAPLKLRYSPTSPFVRKVRVCAEELGLAAHLELLPCDVWAEDSDIVRDNPLGKVPVLLTEEGAFIGSLLCCEYLDGLNGQSALLPIEPQRRWPVLQLHALADGLAEAAVAYVTEELRRPSHYRYQGYLDRQSGKIRRVLDIACAQAPALAGRIDVSTITLACALSYLDLRLPWLQWRVDREALTHWQENMEARASMQRTQYRAPP